MWKVLFTAECEKEIKKLFEKGHLTQDDRRVISIMIINEGIMRDLEEFFSKRDDTPGKVIKSFRKNYNITQSELCSITGISEKYLSAVENDKRPIGVEVASKLAVFFNFDPAILLFPGGLKKLHAQYSDIQKQAKKLIAKKRKSA